MIAIKSTFILYSELFKYGLGFVSLFFVARYMGPSALGIIGIAVGYTLVFSFIADFGLGTAHSKFLADSNTDKGLCNSAFLFLKLVSILLFSSLVVFSILFTKLNDTFPFDYEQEMVIYIILVSTIISHLSRIPKSTFEGNQQPSKSKVPELFQKIILDSLQIIIAVFGLGVILLAGSYVASNLIMLIILFYFYRSIELKRVNKKYIMKYLNFVFPLVPYLVIASLSVGLARILISVDFSVDEVGFFEAATKLALIFALIHHSVQPIIFPKFSSYHSEKKYNKISDLSIKSERYLFIIGTPILFFALFHCEDLINLFLGPAFLPSKLLVQLLLINSFFYMVSLPYVIQLVASGYVSLVSKIGTFSILVKLFFCLILIPKELFSIQLLGLGGLGAAISVLVGQSVDIVIRRYYSRKLNKVSFYYRAFYPVISGFAAFYIINYLFLALNFSLYLSLFFTGFFSSFLYFLLLYFINELKSEDIALFLNSTSPKRMKKYLSKELR